MAQDYKQLAEDMIQANKPVSKIKSALGKYLTATDKSTWDKQIQDEYYALYPTHRDMTYEEYTTPSPVEGEVNANKDVTLEEFEALEEVPTVQIEYDEATYVTLEEYKAETRVVSEAIYYTYNEYLDYRATEDITVTEEEYAISPYLKTEEVTELVRPYIAPEVTDERIQAELDGMSEYVEYKSKAKSEAMEQLTVTHNSVEYDAHTRSRGDMTTITALANYLFIREVAKTSPEMQTLYDAIYKQTLPWKGADNEVHNVQAESIVEGLQLSIDEYAKVIGAKQ